MRGRGRVRRGGVDGETEQADGRAVAPTVAVVSDAVGGLREVVAIGAAAGGRTDGFGSKDGR